MIGVLVFGLVAFGLLFYMYRSSVRADDAIDAMWKALSMAREGRFDEAREQRAYARRLRSYSWIYPVSRRPRKRGE